MWKRIAIVGATAAVIGAAGTAAFAASGTPTSTPPASSAALTSDTVASPTTATAVKHPKANRLRLGLHATWVSENKKTKTFTTHVAIRGQVSNLSPTSITVRAADNVTQTFVINARTKVFTRAPKVAGTKTAIPVTAASISQVKTGDVVFVGGTGRTGLTALRVVDVKK
jgi:hypothetical protein